MAARSRREPSGYGSGPEDHGGLTIRTPINTDDDTSRFGRAERDWGSHGPPYNSSDDSEEPEPREPDERTIMAAIHRAEAEYKKNKSQGATPDEARRIVGSALIKTMAQFNYLIDEDGIISSLSMTRWQRW